MKLSTLPTPTWRWVQVNDTQFELPEFVSEQLTSQMEHEIPQRVRSDWNDCKENQIGVAKDALTFNETYRTKQTVFCAKEGEAISTQVVTHLEEGASPVCVDANYIIAEKDSRISVVLDYTKKEQKEGETFRNSVIHVMAEEGAEVNIYYISRNSQSNVALCSMISQVHQDASVKLVQVELGSQQSFFNYTSNLLEKGASTQIRTIYFTDQNNELNISYRVNHIGRETESDILVNGALKDQAKKTFKGTIDFKKGSCQSKGSEEEYATLLSEKVRNIAVPILLCQEDDVEGVHAASAGKIDEDILFYIMSRGFSVEQAKKIVLESHFTPVLDLIEEESLRDEIWKEIGERI